MSQLIQDMTEDPGHSHLFILKFVAVLVSIFVRISVYSDLKSVRAARTLRGFLDVARRRCICIFRFCTNLPRN